MMTYENREDRYQRLVQRGLSAMAKRDKKTRDIELAAKLAEKDKEIARLREENEELRTELNRVADILIAGSSGVVKDSVKRLAAERSK
jgi:hypothetical protein